MARKDLPGMEDYGKEKGEKIDIKDGLRDLLPEPTENGQKEEDKAKFTLVFNEDLAKQAIKGINRFNQKAGYMCKMKSRQKFSQLTTMSQLIMSRITGFMWRK